MGVIPEIPEIPITYAEFRVFRVFRVWVPYPKLMPIFFGVAQNRVSTDSDGLGAWPNVLPMAAREHRPHDRKYIPNWKKSCASGDDREGQRRGGLGFCEAPLTGRVRGGSRGLLGSPNGNSWRRRHGLLGAPTVRASASLTASDRLAYRGTVAAPTGPR